MQIRFQTRRISASFIVLFSFLFALYPSSKTVAQGNLLIAPKRAVFESRERYKELNLSNTGNDTARYTISFIHYRMKENGSLEELPKSDNSLLFADSFVRFFPRTVILAPGESQVVRLQLTQTSRMFEGEYRTHLYFRSVPKPEPLGETETKQSDTTAITIKLNAVFGIAVPVIIRVGQSTTKVGVANCSFEKADGPYVKLALLRSGNMSCYGDITIDYVAPSGVVTRVAEQKGIAIYTPIDRREVKLAVRNASDVDYTKGKLHIVYHARDNLSQHSIGQTEIYLN